MNARLIGGITFVAGLAALLPAQALAQAGMPRYGSTPGSSKVTYEPVQRTRVGGLDNCMKDEVINGNFCVKKCAEDFRLELAARSANCIATSPEAKVPPPKPPEYVPQKQPPGEKGT